MKARWYHTVPVVTVTALAAQPTAGQTTFISNTPNASWHTPGHWDQGVPDANIQAIIPSGKSCKIYNGQAAAAADSLDVDGTLTVDDEQTLTIDTDSEINGTVVLAYRSMNPASGAKLFITDDLTITGYGGTIEMEGWLNEIDGDDDDHGLELTLESNCTGTLSVDCGLTILGAGRIDSGLVNNGFVIADYGCGRDPDIDCPLSLNYYPKSGDGNWQAQNNGGLQVNTEITGPGTWRIRHTDGNHNAVIEINQCHDGLTGDVIIENGLLRINQNFCTTGDLTLASVFLATNSFTAPVIDVDAGVLVTFSTGGCLSCP